MTPVELGNLLIEAFDGCTLDDINAHSENNTYIDYLKGKLGEEKYKEIDRIDPVTWIEALKILYAHYL